MLAAALFALSSITLQAEDPSRKGSVSRDVSVGRVEVDAYVVDNKGDPIPGLLLPDFKVLVQGRQVKLESVEWVPADVRDAGPWGRVYRVRLSEWVKLLGYALRGWV